MIKYLQKSFNEFLHECEFVRKLRPETLRGYREAISIFLKLSSGSTLEIINSAQIARFFKTLEERERIVGRGIMKKGVNKSTIVTYRSRLNCFFDWLIKKGRIKINPLNTIAFPSVSYVDKKFIKKEDVEKIFTAIHTHHNGNLLILKRNILMFHFLLFCGLRKRELILLQIRDIDVDRKVVIIRAETSKSQTIRKLPLHSEIIFHLKDYLQERKDYTSQYLFVSSRKNDRLSYGGLKHLIQKLNETSGIQFHLHQFRHTFAVNYLKQSSNIFKLKELLGHKDIKQTAIYLRQLPVDELRAEVETMSIDNLI